MLNLHDFTELFRPVTNIFMNVNKPDQIAC